MRNAPSQENESLTTMPVSNVAWQREQRQEQNALLERSEVKNEKRTMDTSKIMNLSFEFGKDAMHEIMDMTCKARARSGEVAGQVGEAFSDLIKNPLSKSRYHSRMMQCVNPAMTEADQVTIAKSDAFFDDHEAQTLEIFGVSNPKVKNIRSIKPFRSSWTTKMIMESTPRNSQSKLECENPAVIEPDQATSTQSAGDASSSDNGQACENLVVSKPKKARSAKAQKAFYEDHEAQTLEIFGIENPKVKNIRSTKPFRSCRSTRSATGREPRSSQTMLECENSVLIEPDQEESTKSELSAVDTFSETQTSENLVMSKPSEAKCTKPKKTFGDAFHDEHEAQTLEIYGVENPKVKNIRSTKPFRPSRSTRATLGATTRSNRKVNISRSKEVPTTKAQASPCEI